MATGASGAPREKEPLAKPHWSFTLQEPFKTQSKRLALADTNKPSIVSTLRACSLWQNLLCESRGNMV